MVNSTSRAGPGREGRHLPSGGPAPRVCERDREVANRGGARPTRAHRRAARCRTLARSENRPRVRAKAVCNHVSLCFSSVSRAPGPSMSPLIMSHINRTRPRQGLQLVIRRVAGPQISHIFDAPARVPRHSPRSRVGLVCSSMRNFLAGEIAPGGVTRFLRPAGAAACRHYQPGGVGQRRERAGGRGQNAGDHAGVDPIALG